MRRYAQSLQEGGQDMAVFRVERNKGYTVMSNYHLKDKRLSLKAKGLLSMTLSLPDEWNYSTRGLAAICKEGVDAIGAALKELEACGYILRSQLRGDRGRIMDTEYVIYEKPQDKPEREPPKKPNIQAFSPHTGFPYMENPDTVNPDTDNPDTEEPDTENPAQYNTYQSSTHKPNKEKSRTDPSIHPSMSAETPDAIPEREAAPSLLSRPDRMDGMDLVDQYRSMILDNIGYDSLVEQYGRERLDAIVELMLETVLSKRNFIRIAGDEYPGEIVRSRLLKVTSAHVQYVFDALDKNTGKIRNIKAYLLTALYNAPVTCDQYYRAEVNHDLYGAPKDDFDLLFDI
jgi:hypothetical protein